VSRPTRLAPPPLEANDQLVTGVIGIGWAIALITLLIARGSLPAADRWWIWTCATGFGVGVFGFCYVPVLKRSRARAARRKAGLPDSQRLADGGNPADGPDS
jgi:Protein of unknown function (DUF2530)